MQTTVAKGVAMSKFCRDPNKNAIFFIFVKVLREKIFEYDKGRIKITFSAFFKFGKIYNFIKKFCVRPP